jgi:7-carboxy-7-deazaguanine synthase (Cx14CxxC type)
MTYTIKEIYYTLQGEGANTGRPAVLLRFSGCNLWTGREEDRADAVCRFCDTAILGTDGPGGGKYEEAAAVAIVVADLWPQGDAGELGDRGTAAAGGRFVVCTGGEPLLQLDGALIAALKQRGFVVALETNGTLPAPPGLDWICVSPKAGADLEQREGDELKLVYPQLGVDPQQFVHLDFTHFFLQPLDDAHLRRNTRLAMQYCMAHPVWRLSLQTHKMLGIP